MRCVTDANAVNKRRRVTDRKESVLRIRGISAAFLPTPGCGILSTSLRRFPKFRLVAWAWVAADAEVDRMVKEISFSAGRVSELVS